MTRILSRWCGDTEAPVLYERSRTKPRKPSMNHETSNGETRRQSPETKSTYERRRTLRNWGILLFFIGIVLAVLTHISTSAGWIWVAFAVAAAVGASMVIMAAFQAGARGEKR
jgi:fatty acid desaturase